MNVERRYEIAFRYLVNAVKRNVVKLPNSVGGITEAAQALDVPPTELDEFVVYVNTNVVCKVTDPFDQRWGELTMFFLKRSLKENGFMFKPFDMRKHVERIAREVGIPYDEAAVFVRELLKDIIDEIFPENESR